MINISYLYIAIVLLAIWTIYRILVLKKSKDKNSFRELIINIFFIYFLVLIKITICKMDALQIDLNGNKVINYIPLVETIKMFKDDGMRFALYNVIGNIILFMPLGFFIPLLFNKKNKISYIVAYGAIISTAIEVIQLQQTYNITDIDDIIFNTLGAILGYLVFNVLYKFMEKTKYSRKLKINFLGNE